MNKEDFKTHSFFKCLLTELLTYWSLSQSKNAFPRISYTSFQKQMSFRKMLLKSKFNAYSHFKKEGTLVAALAALRIGYAQSALEFSPIHCLNGRLGQDLGFGGFAFSLKLPELQKRNLIGSREGKVRANFLFP